MRFIEHIIEPTKLLLAWQSRQENQRTRYIVGELRRMGEEITLAYLPQTKDFIDAHKIGFTSYPAFLDVDKIHHNVLNAFMRRLPPRTRGDYPQYLEGLRLKPTLELSDFALLGYSGAKLLSDGFSLIHPFDNVKGPCELLIEAAGYRHIQKSNKVDIKIDSSVIFVQEFNKAVQENAIHINADGTHIGYVNRGLLPTFFNWMNAKRIGGAWIEKINGTPGKPSVFVFVKVLPT